MYLGAKRRYINTFLSFPFLSFPFPCGAKNLKIGPLSNLNNRRFALRAMLPVDDDEDDVDDGDDDLRVLQRTLLAVRSLCPLPALQLAP